MMNAFIHELRPALVATGLLAALTCGAYPLTVTILGQAAFPDQATGSLIRHKNGRVMGSRWIGQAFSGARYFHPRPSAAGDGYDACNSGGSNLGPTSQKLLHQIRERLETYRRVNGLAQDAVVPADAVTTSGSGLDPHISPANARMQAARIARERGLSQNQVEELIFKHTETPTFGLLGEARVNVLELNLALDSREAPAGF